MIIILYTLLMAALLHIGCGEGTTVGSVGASSSSAGGAGGFEAQGGFGGAGGQGGSGICTVDYVAGVCDDCKANGCPMADPKDPDACHYIGVVHYTSFVGCSQQTAPQALCEACFGITVGDPIPLECEQCAAPITGCSYDCTTEASDGQQ